ncbi:27-O-demethylrifamycin SV methyltransferase [Fundidesulfovibrio magnetotacticus]|uniref:27-O-demethylrifamycin SV methyltransferase n=1 Tax=Fundidesulfovibrio magnetotacticus TaxID=2730080 RepID=A0A6V8LTN5_9BACT|nr:methyltransferase domain-containing protein [Fundidesulfovibrio magnetotacticus]GFK93941.1 27-O-demethylrifamycin SV methyltransferase [Fundidesulfovibrio magnetotacticus]
MSTINEGSYASIQFSLAWRSAEATHEERFLARKANLWRDIFPPGFKDLLMGLGAGEGVRASYAPGRGLPGREASRVVELPRRAFRGRSPSGRDITPRAGRFYPLGFFEGLPGVYPQDARPGRVLRADESLLRVDMGHPFAWRTLDVTAQVLEVRDKTSDTGGRISCWMEELCDGGPGLQARCEDGCPTDFADADAMTRLDPSDDALFHETPRLVNHVDSGAAQVLREAAMRRVRPGTRVLDLMAGWRTHLDPCAGIHVTGLGMNAQELAANPLLAERVVHDLNKSPLLPFPDASFDAVVCTLSIEYLIRPLEVVAECARVLAPGGELVIGFSDRWFPTKVPALWMDLHPFERLGWVLDLLLRDGRFEGLWTFSDRNRWRPADDPHIRQTFTGDPVFVAGGRRA